MRRPAPKWPIVGAPPPPTWGDVLWGLVGLVLYAGLVAGAAVVVAAVLGAIFKP